MCGLGIVTNNDGLEVNPIDPLNLPPRGSPPARVIEKTQETNLEYHSVTRAPPSGPTLPDQGSYSVNRR